MQTRLITQNHWHWQLPGRRREICDVLLAVNRKFNKSDYIPCIAWGNNAQLVSKMQVPSSLKIIGRIQSREYNKAFDNKAITKTAYEVSISKLVNDVL